MTKPQRVTAKKYQGDDTLSWAVFVDGRPTYTGLSRPEAQHYRDRKRRELATADQPKFSELLDDVASGKHRMN
jgi:hypothetical protein